MLNKRILLVTALALTLGGCGTPKTMISGSICLQGGCFNGPGMLRLQDGSVVSGNFIEGFPDGPVNVRHRDGSKQTQQMRMGYPHGEGTRITSRGTTISEVYTAGVLVKGQSERANGDIYEGTFVTRRVKGEVPKEAKSFLKAFSSLAVRASYLEDVTPSTRVQSFDEGTYTTANGDIFSGKFDVQTDAKMLSRFVLSGTATYASGEKTSGQFVAENVSQGAGLNLKKDGEHTISYPDDSTYKGEFKNDRKVGLGVLTFSNNKDRIQKWVDGEMISEGPGPRTIVALQKRPKCNLVDAGKDWIFYEGGCENGMAEGKAIAYAFDGLKKIEGTFQGGQFIKGTLTDDQTKVTGKWNNFEPIGDIAIEENGQLAYEGGFLNGKRHGRGICFNDGSPESCEYYRGERIDALHKQRMEMAKFKEDLIREQEEKVLNQKRQLMASADAKADPRFGRPSSKPEPQIRKDNGGLYCSPYTSDGVLAEWVDTAIKSEGWKKIGGGVGATAGAALGSYAAKKALQNVPFGGILGGIAGAAIGNAVGQKVGQSTYLSLVGGMENVRRTSDISADSLEDLALYLYKYHSGHEHYQNALKATFGIYPAFENTYEATLRN